MLRDVVGEGSPVDDQQETEDEDPLAHLSVDLSVDSEAEETEEEELLEEEEAATKPRRRKPRPGVEISVKKAQKVLRKEGNYPDDVIENTIAVLDPDSSGVITIVDFYDTLQRKTKAPPRRKREKMQSQRKSFPAGLVKPDVRNLDSMFAGIGVQFGIKRVENGEDAEAAQEEVVVVRGISPGGPAEGGDEENAPHLEIGDEVLKVDGIPTAGLTAERAYVFTVGKAGTSLELLVRRFDAGQNKLRKVEVLLSRAAGYEKFSEFRPEHNADKVALAASDALNFYVKRGKPPVGNADVGILLERDSNDFMIVKDVLPNSPAANSGQVAAGNLVHFIGDDDLQGLTASDAQTYLKGPDTSVINITLSDVHGALQGNLRVLPLQRRMPDEDGKFAGRLTAPGSEGSGGSDDSARVVRLVLDGNFDTQLKDDEAAQHIYGINLCTDVADSLQVPKSRLSVSALQAGSILADIRVTEAPTDDETASAADVMPGDSASMPGREQSKSVFAPARQRSAQDIAAELVEQATNPMSALRMKRPDLKSGQHASKHTGDDVSSLQRLALAGEREGIAAKRGGGEAGEVPPVDVIDVVTGQFVSGGEHAQRKKEQPSRTEASAEESQKLLAREQAREQARELGTATISHAVATRPPGGGAGDDGEEDDGIPLDLHRGGWLDAGADS